MKIFFMFAFFICFSLLVGTSFFVFESASQIKALQKSVVDLMQQVENQKKSFENNSNQKIESILESISKNQIQTEQHLLKLQDDFLQKAAQAPINNSSYKEDFDNKVLYATILMMLASAPEKQFLVLKSIVSKKLFEPKLLEPFEGKKLLGLEAVFEKVRSMSLTSFLVLDLSFLKKKAQSFWYKWIEKKERESEDESVFFLKLRGQIIDAIEHKNWKLAKTLIDKISHDILKDEEKKDLTNSLHFFAVIDQLIMEMLSFAPVDNKGANS